MSENEQSFDNKSDVDNSCVRAASDEFTNGEKDDIIKDQSLVQTDNTPGTAQNLTCRESGDDCLDKLQTSKLEEYKTATLKLLTEVEAEITVIPESDVSEDKNVCSGQSLPSVIEGKTIDLTEQITNEVETYSEVTGIPESNIPDVRSDLVSKSAIDLTKSDSVEIVTLLSDSSAENSRSSSKDVEITVDLTNDQSSNTQSLQESQKISKRSNSPQNISNIPERSSDNISVEEPSVKRQKVETESFHVDLTEEVSMTTDADVVEIHETENNTLTASSIENVNGSVFEFKGPPRQLTGAWECFKSSNNNNNNNYLRGCKWAPDGTCLLTNSNDNKLKIFNLPDELYYNGGENKNLPEMTPVFSMKESDTVYDFCWYPLMSSSMPETACLAVTSKDTPVHLYDAFTGDLRCSYRAYNHVDEVVAAYCVQFSGDGSKLYCGFKKMIRVFDVTRPGRNFENRPTFAKDGQRGIISCIDNCPTEPGLYAAGSYSRSIALYNEPAGSMVCMFEGQHGGVTQVKFSPDGTRLYSGGRKDNEILCWDMRNPGQILFSLLRTVVTNQRIYFDITSDGNYLVSGSHDGSVLVWDTTRAPVQLSVNSDPIIQPVMAFEAHTDTVNGLSLHPSLPVIATSSGQRHFPSFDNDDSDIETIPAGDNRQQKIDNSLRLWWT